MCDCQDFELLGMCTWPTVFSELLYQGLKTMVSMWLPYLRYTGWAILIFLFVCFRQINNSIFIFSFSFFVFLFVRGLMCLPERGRKHPPQWDMVIPQFHLIHFSNLLRSGACMQKCPAFFFQATSVRIQTIVSYVGVGFHNH